MQPCNTPHHPVTVEYDSRSGRASRTFASPYAARRFYVAKFRANRNPKVLGARHAS